MNYQNFIQLRIEVFIFILLLISTLFSCQKHPDKKLENYLLDWRADSNYVLLQYFRPNSIKGTDCTIGCKLFQLNSSIAGNVVETVLENAKGLSLVGNDTILLAKKEEYGLGNIPSSFSGSPFYHFPESVHTLQNDIGFKDYNNIEIGHITAGNVVVNVNDSMHVNILAEHLERLEISGNANNTSYPLELNFSYDREAVHGLVIIENKQIRKISIGQHIRHLTLLGCTVNNWQSEIFGEFAPDTLELRYVKFSSPAFKLNMFQLAGPTDKKPVVLICDGTDISNVAFDYSFFDFNPFAALAGDVDKNSLYSYNKVMFRNLIKNQQSANNEGGKNKAQVDSAKYENSYHALGFLENPLKSWWNSYGFDKEKVIWNALELFFGVTIINLFVFSKMNEAYTYAEIDKAFKVIQLGHNERTKPLKTFFICAIYTGFIFFGLKLDIEKLKLADWAIAFWIVVQYVAGLIALAYIANLVLGK